MTKYPHYQTINIKSFDQIVAIVFFVFLWPIFLPFQLIDLYISYRADHIKQRTSENNLSHVLKKKYVFFEKLAVIRAVDILDEKICFQIVTQNRDDDFVHDPVNILNDEILRIREDITISALNQIESKKLLESLFDNYLMHTFDVQYQLVYRLKELYNDVDWFLYNQFFKYKLHWDIFVNITDTKVLSKVKKRIEEEGTEVNEMYYDYFEKRL